jgi:hypothetical protein
MFRIKIRSRWYRTAARLMTVLGILCGYALGQTPGEAPLISLTAPGRNQTYTDNSVTATVHFRADADVSTFRAQLNGEDVSSDFQQTSNCQSGICDLQAYLSGNGFLHGANALSVEVESAEATAADDLVQFNYEAPLVESEPVSKLTPSVAVSSVRLRSGAPTNDYKSYDIVVGPGPDFPQQVYSGADLSCGAGLNSVQVLVLQRKTLSPETTNSRQCFSDATSLANFLNSVPAKDLVILNNFLGRMPNIDTRAIGGTNYAGSNINTNYYNAIGIAGAPVGTAYESYQPDNSHTPRLGEAFLPPLTGSLMLDTARNYFFAPKDFPEIKVIPGTQNNCSTITVNQQEQRQCIPGNSLGAFYIVAVDRRLGYITDHYYLDTNSNDPTVRKSALWDFAYLLRAYYKPGDLLAISTVGTPIRASSEVSGDLWHAITTLGGNGFALPKLTTTGSAYTLITSPDPNYVNARYPRESTTVRAGETAKLDLVFSRDKKNQFVLYQDYPGNVLTAFNGNVWPSTVFQQPQNWPAWTPGQAAAYADLTSSDHYPTLRSALACHAATCPGVRQYYSSNMALCSAPTSLAPVIHALTYVPGFGYTPDDLSAVKAQLTMEIGYEGAIASLCGYVRQLTDSQQTNLQRQLIAVGSNINSSLQQKAVNAQIQVDQLTRYANIASIGSVVPYVGGAFSAVSTLLNASTLLISTDANIPGNFTYTLAQLQDKNNAVFGAQLTMLVTNMFTAIADDWGKLSLIGAAIGEQRTPWYFCANCDNAPPPLTALPMIALGAKRDYYQTLLPTAFDIDYFTEYASASPVRYQRDVAIFGGRICIYPYGTFPENSYWNYTALYKPTTYDIDILNEKTRNGNYAVSPSAALLSDLVDAPVIDNASLTLSGGAGLIYDDFIRAGSNFTSRPAYAPGITCTR